MILHNVDLDEHNHEVALEVWCCECKKQVVAKLTETPWSKMLECAECSEIMAKEKNR